MSKGGPATSVSIPHPDIILDGHQNAQEDYISRLPTNDLSSAPDTMIIMGMSMKVRGLQKIVEDFARTGYEHKPLESFSSIAVGSRKVCGKGSSVMSFFDRL